MRRLGIGAIGRLLGRGRLPVGGKLALATLVREHGVAARWSCVVLARRGLSQCDAAVGRAAAQVQERRRAREGRWWCGRSSGAGEVSQNTGRRAATSAAGESDGQCCVGEPSQSGRRGRGEGVGRRVETGVQAACRRVWSARGALERRAELGEGGCGVKGFSKRVEETTGPKSVEAKKEIQVGAAAITTHRVPELNLLAASTGMAFLSLPAPCSDDGDGPPNALNAMRHPHLQRDVQLGSPPIRAHELPASSTLSASRPYHVVAAANCLACVLRPRP